MYVDMFDNDGWSKWGGGMGGKLRIEFGVSFDFTDKFFCFIFATKVKDSTFSVTVDSGGANLVCFGLEFSEEDIFHS